MKENNIVISLTLDQAKTVLKAFDSLTASIAGYGPQDEETLRLLSNMEGIRQQIEAVS